MKLWYVMMFLASTTVYCANDVRIIAGESFFASEEVEECAPAEDKDKKKPVVATGYRTFVEPTDCGFHVKVLVVRSDGSLMTLWDYLQSKK